MSDTPKAGIRARLTQIRAAFVATKNADPRFVPVLAAASLGTAVVIGVVGSLLLSPWFGVSTGIMLGLLVAMVIFGRRVQSTAMASIEGQPGAAAAVLQSMRGPWKVIPAVAITRKQDFVHRVIGRPGIIVVGEGSPSRVAMLLKQEQRRAARVAGEVPVHTISVGNREGQVPLGKLQTAMAKLPRAVKAKEIGALERKLGALGGPDMPIPKGPIPKAPKKMR